MDRRQLLLRSSFGAGAAWIAPSLVGLDVAGALCTPLCVSRTNVALSGTAAQSSLGFGGVPSRGNDGNTSGVHGNGSVFHTVNGLAEWWEVDLGASHSIDEVVIYNRTDGCCVTRAQNVALSVDGTGAGTFPMTSGSWVTSTLNCLGVTGQVVRVTNGITNYFHLAEVEVYGCLS